MKLKPNIFFSFANALCLMQLVGMLIYLALAWNSLPEQIPGHFGADGVVTRYDGRGALLVMPIMNWIMFGVISLIERFPQTWNVGVKVTEENKLLVYGIIRNLIVTVKLVIVTAFTFIGIVQSLAQNLPSMFLPVLLVSLFGSLIYWTIRLRMAR